jgi:hypothetical protein
MAQWLMEALENLFFFSQFKRIGVFIVEHLQAFTRPRVQSLPPHKPGIVAAPVILTGGGRRIRSLRSPALFETDGKGP